MVYSCGYNEIGRKKNLTTPAQIHKGFTLVELLVVIAIISAMAAAVVLMINPLELTARGRDSTRLIDLANLQNAISVAVQEAATTTALNAILCVGMSPPCRGTSRTDGRTPDGTGWVKVDISAQKSVSMPTLPIDPTNSTSRHYTYCSDGSGWEIDSTLESQKEQSKLGGDGGNDPAYYEVGSNLNLIASSGGSCTYNP